MIRNRLYRINLSMNKNKNKKKDTMGHSTEKGVDKNDESAVESEKDAVENENSAVEVEKGSVENEKHTITNGAERSRCMMCKEFMVAHQHRCIAHLAG
jgi:hypothetical protein